MSEETETEFTGEIHAIRATKDGGFRLTVDIPQEEQVSATALFILCGSWVKFTFGKKIVD